MRTTVAMAALLLFASSTARAQALPPQVVSVDTRDSAQIQRMSEQFTHMQIDAEKGLVRVEADTAQLQWLHAQGLSLSVDKNASEALQAQTAGRSLRSIPGFACYRTVEETQAGIDALIAARPDLASKIDIGDSWEKVTAGGNPGYDLVVLKLTNSAIPGPKPKMFAMTAIHAREYTTAELNTRFAEWLVNRYGSDPEATWLLDHNEFHLLLQSNPDGRKQAETGLSWRKNTNTAYCGATSNSRGADLNRNYPFHWGPGGSSGDPCVETYRGPAAGSEPETQAVMNYIQGIFPDQRPDDTTTPAPDTTPGIFFDIHSFSQLVLWPWGDVSGAAPNGAAMEMLGRRIAWFNGYRPMQIIGLYPTTGTTADTAYGQLGVASLSIELGTAFFENCSSFDNSTYPRNVAALHYAARTLAAPYKLAYGPDAQELSATPALVVPGETVQIRARVNDAGIDTRPQPQSGAPPVPATQNVASARLYVDTPPHAAGAAAQAMSAADGNFDSSSELVQAQLDTSSFAQGKHLIYVQGRDSSGADGAPNAVFVDVAEPAQIATLSGSVRGLPDATPLAALIRVDNVPVQSDANGNYSHRQRSGTVNILAGATGYMSERIDGLALAGGSTLTRDFLLQPLCTLFSDDVEAANPGWTAQTPWATSTTVSGNASRVWTDSPAGNYANNVNTSLTSPLLDFSGYDELSLSFRQRCATEAGYDFGIVEISTNPNSPTPQWSELSRCSGERNWSNTLVNLPLSAAGQAAVKLRFRLVSDTADSDEGWSIDDIRIQAGGAACRATRDSLFADDFEG